MKEYKVIDKWKKDGFSVVFTNGCFDILHYGHLSLLRSAQNLGDKVVVGLNSDKSVRKLKGRNRPIIPEIDRKMSLLILPFVDCVVLFDDLTPIDVIKYIKPSVLLKGGDWEGDYNAGKVVGSEYATKTHIFPFQGGYSTTNIINKIRSINYE